MKLFVVLLHLFVFRFIEDIFFLEVNTKYISSILLKTSEFSWVRSTSENFDVLKSWDDIYLVFNEEEKKSFYLIYTF